MRVFLATTALAAVLVVGASASAQPGNWNHNAYNNNHNASWSNHSDWRNHGHVSQNDWNRGSQVDWRAHHLHQPPSGYEWRQIDGRYVLAAVATGIIASIILSSQ
jgi:Ni/Co efflux regulator RcnB